MVKLRLKKGLSIHRTLQNAIVATINDPNYSFSLPTLSDWESIVSSSEDEKQRLEFVGDAVMHLSVALYLYRLFPDATPGLYTNLRSAVNANATFTYLMVKAGAYELLSQSHSTKAVADSFEVIVAALYLERGFAAVCAWVQEQYAPLITAARESYDKCLATPDRNIPLLPTKRHGGPLDSANTPLLKKIRLSSGRSSPRRTLMAQRVISRMKSKGRVKLCRPTKKSKRPLETCLNSCELPATESQESSSSVIDLTMDSESDEGPVPSNVIHTSQPSFKPFTLSQDCLPPSQSDITPQSGESSYKHTVSHQPPQQGSATSLASLPPSASSATSLVATQLDHTTSIVPQASFEFFRRPGLSLSPQSDNIHIHSGTYGNPIVIEDSETEN